MAKRHGTDGVWRAAVPRNGPSKVPPDRLERIVLGRIRSWARGRRASRRPHLRGGDGVLAMFTPLPPEQTGVAAYSAQLIAELRHLVPIEVFVADDIAVDPVPGVAIAPVSAFAGVDAVAPYEHVLYCMGNSDFHHFMWEPLRRRPGHVLAHDIRFEGFFRLMAMKDGDIDAYRRRVRGDAPEATAAAGEDGLLTAAAAVANDVYMVREVAAHARKLLVHSDYAADLARRHVEPSDRDKVERVRFGIPAGQRRARRPDDRLVATFGLTDPIKLPDVLLRAAAACGVDGVTVAFVGFTDPGYEAALREVGREAGLSDGQMVFTGYLDDSAYHSWLARATVAVQLRAASNGETSAAVADCLRFGVPTIVADVGSGREYPEDVAVPVAVDAGAGPLGVALEALLRDEGRRRRMTAAALDYVDQASFAAAAESIGGALGL